MNARAVLTATAFMVLGVMNKLLTIILNKFLLSDEASTVALVGVLLAIAAGIFWQYSVASKLTKICKNSFNFCAFSAKILFKNDKFCMIRSISASLLKEQEVREETPSDPLEYDEEAPREV
mgnify:CR=1 FL=1